MKCALHTCALLGLLTAAQAVSGNHAPSQTRDLLAADIDLGANPGDDFYQFANGGWLKRNAIPPTESHWGIDTLVRDQLESTLREVNERAAAEPGTPGSVNRKIGDFWSTAVDAQRAERFGIHPLARELARIDRVRTISDVIDTAFYLHWLDVDALFTFGIGQDERDSEAVAIYVRQGGLGLPDREFYVSSAPGMEHIRQEYRRHLTRTLMLLGLEAAAAANAGDAVLKFETELALASRRLEDTRDPIANYHRIELADLTRTLTPLIDWQHQMSVWHLQPRSVVVCQPEYLQALDGILRKTPVSALRDYLRIHLVTSYAEYLSSEYDRENFHFYSTVLTGQKEPRPRWERILETESSGRMKGIPITVANPIGMLVGELYVQRAFPESTKRRYVHLVEALEQSFAERIERVDWMSTETKGKALRKLGATRAQVGYPDRWLDYSGLIVGRRSYCENMMNVARWRFRRMLARFGKPVNRDEWRMTPQTFNAYYDASNNQIVLLAAITTVPGVADAQLDDAVVFGYVGTIIGHELTHGFDDQGRRFDARGDIRDWWAPSDASAFKQRAEALVRQFDGYQPIAGIHINGKATLGENIADLGGILIAFDAFRRTEEYRHGETIGGFTPTQRFFLAYAFAWMGKESPERMRRELLSDVHAPDKWRVLGPLSNIPEFYDAFKIKPGQPMWRAASERVAIW